MGFGLLLLLAAIGYVLTHPVHDSLWWLLLAIPAWYVLTFDLTKLGPVRLLRGWTGFFARRSPVQKELAVASHGAGVLALCAFAWLCVWATHRGDVTGFLNEGDWQIWAVFGWAGMIVLGFAMLRTGWRASYDLGDVYGERVIMRGLGKLALAVAVWGFFFHGWFWPLLPDEVQASIALARAAAPPVRWAVMAVILWCTVTASTKIILVLRSRRPAPNAPPTVPNSRGQARDMTAAEARNALARPGGQKIALDDEDF